MGLGFPTLRAGLGDPTPTIAEFGTPTRTIAGLANPTRTISGLGNPFNNEVILKLTLMGLGNSTYKGILGDPIAVC